MGWKAVGERPGAENPLQRRLACGMRDVTCCAEFGGPVQVREKSEVRYKRPL